MKKYSFSSVDNTRKRYAFSSYQHPKTTHTYLFEAELKRVIQANHKFYHFENRQIAKRYDFTAHLNYVKRYDFEMKLIQFENGRIRKYDFVATKPHKRYDFTSKLFKRAIHYHFDSWAFIIYEAEIVRPEVTNSSKVIVEGNVLTNEAQSLKEIAQDLEEKSVDNFSKGNLIFGAEENTQMTGYLHEETFGAKTITLDSFEKKTEIFTSDRRVTNDSYSRVEDSFNSQQSFTLDSSNLIDAAFVANKEHINDGYQQNEFVYLSNNQMTNDGYQQNEQMYLMNAPATNDRYKQIESVYSSNEYRNLDKYDFANATNAKIELFTTEEKLDVYRFSSVKDANKEHTNDSHKMLEQVLQTITQAQDSIFEMAENASVRYLDTFDTKPSIFESKHNISDKILYEEKDCILDGQTHEQSKMLIADKTVLAYVAEQSKMKEFIAVNLAEKVDVSVFETSDLFYEGAFDDSIFKTNGMVLETHSDNEHFEQPLLIDANLDSESIRVKPILNTNVDYEVPTTQNIIDVNIDHETFLTKDDVLSADSLKVEKIKPKPPEIHEAASDYEKIKTYERSLEATVDNEILKNTPIVDVDIDYENIQIKPILDTNVDNELIEVTPVFDVSIDFESIKVTPVINTNIDYEKIKAVPLIDVDIDDELIKVTPVLNANIDKEAIKIAPILESAFDFESINIENLFETNEIVIDPFKLPNGKDKKPMWLIQSRPRWGARYFTQVRR